MDTDRSTEDENQCHEALEEDLDRRTGQHLYVMQNSRLPELKIGRSSNVDARRRSLQASQNFVIHVLAIFPHAGHLEPVLHKFLSHCRVSEDVAGREWFRCSLETVLGAINLALASHACRSEGASSSEDVAH